MEIKDITFAYDDKVTRLHHIHGQIKKGEITAIIGPNGCGKSTLLGVLTHHYLPQEGQVILNGKILQHYQPRELAKVLGVVHQRNIAPADLTVEALVNYGRLPHQSIFTATAKKDEEMVEWALERTGLYEKRKQTIDTLSGGQQQRVWIAMTLAQDTPYLFLDEPTSNLDIYFQYEILDLVKQLRDDHCLTIVMVLHDINQAIKYCDTIIAMKDGRIIAKGDPKEIVTTQFMHDIYGVHVVIKEDTRIGKYIVPLGI